MSKKNSDFEDDGRTVADMSGIERQRIFLPRLPKKKQDDKWEIRQESESEKMSREDRRIYLLGSLSASLLIAGIFILAAFLFIVIFLAIYK
ncbi:MAG: hypothetical protein IJS90_03105 [Clostridia bacterium]|nr:hypothetical protein [Clostridia bacterium]